MVQLIKPSTAAIVLAPDRPRAPIRAIRLVVQSAVQPLVQSCPWCAVRFTTQLHDGSRGANGCLTVPLLADVREGSVAVHRAFFPPFSGGPQRRLFGRLRLFDGRW